VSDSNAHEQFHERWTHRLWSSGHSHEVVDWCEEFMAEHGDHTWHRLIINNWSGVPFDSMSQVFSVVKWLSEAAHPAVFASPRGRSSVIAGVQIWCVSPEVQLLVHMMASPVLQVRTLTPEELASHLELMLTWRNP
jgi:hypothetical protein